ncbi:MAG: hypothetical protein JWQ88_3854 [Rhodoferax sp.]|nr:hypothetical protein [Rhodoferax sp.]
MDLSFLRVLAAGHLPRHVPPGPAFQLTISYRDAGYVVADIPLPLKKRSGGFSQPDAVVTGITTSGWEALGFTAQPGA